VAPLLTSCLVFSLQVLLTSGLVNPHPDSYRDPQGGLLKKDMDSTSRDSGEGDTIKIGLLIQDKNSTAALRASELAVQKVNQNGGLNGLPVRLVVRSMEGPWGTGSREAVSLIFDENVIGILGSNDGRNAHLVEQVAAKSRVVFLSAWTGDPTLSQAFVPWFFNCVFNNLQQADALIEEIYNRRNLVKIAVVSDKSYDSQSALNNFLKNLARQGKPEPLILSYDSAGKDINDLTERIIRSETGCAVLFVQPPASVKIIQQIKLKHMNLPVFGSFELLDENHITEKDMKDYEKVAFVSSVNLSGRAGIAFSEDYKKRYGIIPGAVAACAFDGLNILIEAIKMAGTEREKIQKAIAAIKYEGVTGTIQFDEKGNRKGTPVFVEIKNGIPVRME
jgi:branched-chain amino acid transport system substrate-binding protein